MNPRNSIPVLVLGAALIASSSACAAPKKTGKVVLVESSSVMIPSRPIAPAPAPAPEAAAPGAAPAPEPDTGSGSMKAGVARLKAQVFANKPELKEKILEFRRKQNEKDRTRAKGPLSSRVTELRSTRTSIPEHPEYIEWTQADS